MVSVRIQWRLLAALVILFILFTVIGTLSHEAGHAVVAKHYGYKPHIGYDYTTYADRSRNPRMDSLMRRYRQEIGEKQYFPDSAYYWTQHRVGRVERRAIVWGGPAQTMLTGTIGLGLLLGQWKRFRMARRLSVLQWLVILLALFWLRQVTNLVVDFGLWILTGYQSNANDEVRLAHYYGLPTYIISGASALIALFAFTIVYCAIPRGQRATFILAGAVGGVTGYLVWLEWLGPILMP